MNANNLILISRFHRLAAVLLSATLSCLTGCSTDSPAYNGQAVFDRPEAAVTALAAAAKARDAARLEAIFGPDAKELLSSGDPVADRQQREVFVVAFDEKWTLERRDSSSKELVIGHDAWPFPIPLMKDRRGWWFDTAAGKQEVLARRVGRNELAAIGALRTYVLAQREYAGLARDSKSAGVFARQVRSDPGTHNGLYWPATNPADPPSPLGQFAAAAASEGYGTQPKASPAPYHGYYFRILTQQGPDAPGGARDYIVGGEMTGGFAMVAFPAEYGNSGIMSFLVGADGIVYESDLGEDTGRAAAGLTQFNPGSDWQAID